MNSIRSLVMMALTAASMNLVFGQSTDVIIDFGNPEPAQLLSPPNTVPLSSTTERFNWSTGSEVQAYWVYIGSAPGKSDIVNQPMGLQTSLTVQQLPINGKPIYLQLFSNVAGQWESFTYTYATAAATSVAKMITPADGSTLPGSTVTFTWSPATGAQQYFIYAGTQPGANNLVGQSAGLNTTITINNLPMNGQSLYITLFTLAGGQWKSEAYRYTTGSAGTAQAVPGLAYYYYEQPGMTTLPDFSKLTPVESGTVSNFDLSNRNRDNDFAFLYTGYVRIDVAGDYTFFTKSDDGSQLFVDGKLLVDNNGLHASIEKSATKTLARGYHQITLVYFQGPGGNFLDVNWSALGMQKQHIPNGQLFHAVSTN